MHLLCLFFCFAFVIGYLSSGLPSLHAKIQLGIRLSTSHKVPFTHPCAIFRFLRSTIRQPSFRGIVSGNRVFMCCNLLISASLRGCPFESVSAASSTCSFPSISFRHSLFISSTSLRVEQIITVLLRSTDFLYPYKLFYFLTQMLLVHHICHF